MVIYSSLSVSWKQCITTLMINAQKYLHAGTCMFFHTTNGLLYTGIEMFNNTFTNIHVPKPFHMTINTVV